MPDPSYEIFQIKLLSIHIPRCSDQLDSFSLDFAKKMWGASVIMTHQHVWQKEPPDAIKRTSEDTLILGLCKMCRVGNWERLNFWRKVRVPYISQRLTSFSDAPLYVNSPDRRSENYLTSDLIQRDGRSIPSIAIDFSMPSPCNVQSKSVKHANWKWRRTRTTWQSARDTRTWEARRT